MTITRYKNPIIISFVFLFMFTVNYLTPLIADDYNYSFMWDKSKKIETILDVIKSQHMHYFQWGGRTIAHTIGQTLLMTSKFIRSFLNSFIYVLMIVLIYWHSQGKKMSVNKNMLTLLLIIFFCWVSLPNFGETTIWLIGSVNYLWTAVIILIFMIPYRLKFLSKRVYKDTILFSLVMFLLGLIAGWSNENTSLTAIALTFIAIIYFYKKRRIEKWMLTGFAGALTGYLILILAPGNMVRASLAQKPEDYSFVVHHIKVPLLATSKIMMYQSPVWIALVVILAILLYNCHKNHIVPKDIISKYGPELLYSLTLIVFSVFNNLLMFASPSFPLRAGFGSTVLLIIGVISLLRIDVIQSFIPKKNYVLKAVIAVFLIVTMGFVIKQYAQLNQEYKTRVALINELKSSGNYTAIVDPYSINALDTYQTMNNHVFISDIGKEPTVWPNTVYAQFYGLKSIQIDSD